MPVSYDPALTTAKDQVRLIIGDTDIADAFLQDGEINFFLTAEGNVQLAAIAACLAIAIKLARDADTVKIDVISLSSDKSAQYYLDLAARLRTKLNQSGGFTIFAGGLTDANGNESKPAFTRDLHGNPGGAGINER